MGRIFEAWGSPKIFCCLFQALPWLDQYGSVPHLLWSKSYLRWAGICFHVMSEMKDKMLATHSRFKWWVLCALNLATSANADRLQSSRKENHLTLSLNASLRFLVALLLASPWNDFNNDKDVHISDRYEHTAAIRDWETHVRDETRLGTSGIRGVNGNPTATETNRRNNTRWIICLPIDVDAMQVCFRSIRQISWFCAPLVLVYFVVPNHSGCANDHRMFIHSFLLQYHNINRFDAKQVLQHLRSAFGLTIG